MVCRHAPPRRSLREELEGRNIKSRFAGISGICPTAKYNFKQNYALQGESGKSLLAAKAARKYETYFQDCPCVHEEFSPG